uniref:anti-sigma factor family protein n=1 Tax=Desulforadius tongensis TaxID=1216062 RepID=UPI00195AEEBF|nr:zf-HC2 domain-containing protein [Desulforadius tongensis]
MTCADFSGLIMDLVLGELPPDRREMVENHLEHCERCRREYQLLKQVTTGLRNWSDGIEVPALMEKRLEKALRSEIKPPLKRILPYLAAAALTLVLAVGLWGEAGMTTFLDGKKAVVKEDALEKLAVNPPDVPRQKTKEAAGSNMVNDEIKSAPRPPEAEKFLEQAAPMAPPPAGGKEQEYAGEIKTKGLRAAVRRAAVISLAEITPDKVRQIEIKDNNERSYTLQDNRRELISMMLEGISEAVPAAENEAGEHIITHVINIQLTDGTSCILNYDLENNAVFFNGKLIYPGAGFARAVAELQH